MPYIIDDSKVPDKDYIEYVISCANKEIRQDDALTRRIIYAALSANTNDPINLGIIAPTSEGKTYPVTKALKYLPKEDAWLVGSMSPKTLVRQNGILVDDNNEPLRPRLKELDRKIQDAENGRDNKSVLELNEQKEQLLENHKYLIDLRGKVLVFLEPPDRALWNLLKPILSHDSYHLEFPFVDRNDKHGIHAKRVVMQGYPACIFCSAKDESNWPDWDQVVSRFLICSPNMTVTKYQESNILVGIRSGLPTCIQEKIVISEEEMERARECYRYVRDELRELTKATSSREGRNPVWIPYSEYLAEALPAERGTDVRTAKIIFSFLNVVTLSRAHLRYKLVIGIERCIIADLTDLEEVLLIALDLNGIPAYKVKFLKNDFYPLYDAKTGPNQKDGKTEKVKGLTTKELAEHIKARYHRPISTDLVKKMFLNELETAGFIDSIDSELDHRQKIYYPIVEFPERSTTQEEKLTYLSESTRFDKFLHVPKIRIQNNCKDIPNDWLIFSILSLARYRIDLSHFAGCLADELAVGPDFKIIDKQGTGRLRVCQFIPAYQKDRKLDLYFFRPKFSSKIFVKLRCLKDEDSREFQQMYNASCTSPSSGTNDSKVNTHTDKIISVEEFFYEDPSIPYKPLPEHELEQSPCYAIIGKKGNMYSCKLHPDVKNIHLSDIEHHCKYKDPEMHKTEIRNMEDGRCK